MKILRNLSFTLVSFFVIESFLLAAQQQNYTSAVLLSAPWGQKNLRMDKEPSAPGEFGLFDPYTRNPKAFDEGPVQGPSSFTIAPNGDIYIVDTFNDRIQRFNQSGSFVAWLPAPGSGWAEDIAVDILGNVYLLYLGPAEVWKLDPDGHLLKVFHMFDTQDSDAVGMSYGGGLTRLYCDNSGRLFLSYYKNNDRSRAIFQFGTTTTEFSPEQQKTNLRRGSAGSSGLILNKDQVFQMISGKMFSVDNAGNPIVEYKLLGSYSFFDADTLDHVYLTYYDGGKNTYSIKKQTSNGVVISSFEWQYPRYQLPPPHNTTISVETKKELMMDTQGNIYVLGLTNSGVSITKWSPK